MASSISAGSTPAAFMESEIAAMFGISTALKPEGSSNTEAFTSPLVQLVTSMVLMEYCGLPLSGVDLARASIFSTAASGSSRLGPITTCSHSLFPSNMAPTFLAMSMNGFIISDDFICGAIHSVVVLSSVVVEPKPKVFMLIV
jgi:hypothetical protein